MSKLKPGTHPAPEVMAAMIDGNLGDEERAAFVQHLAECEECRETLSEFARAVNQAGQAGHSPRLHTTRFLLPLAAAVMLATVAGLFVYRNQPPAVTITPAPSPAPPAPSIPAPPAPPAPAPATPEDLGTRRSGARTIGGKTFRLVAGEWVDSAYDPLALLPVENVTATNRDAILAKVPALTPFTGLGPRFTVVLDGVVYRFGTP